MTEVDPPRPALSVSLRHLRLFESVARLRSVRRASEECHLSQPAVTQAIAKLESQIGMPLLERSTSGTYLNEFGSIFYRRTQRLFTQIERALMELGIPDSSATADLIASRLTRSQIRSLRAIVEHGSFAQAAAALGVSQTSLQRPSRDLERTLGKQLYAQTAVGVIATPTAVVFSRKLKLAMQELESAADELEAANGNYGSKIVIGAMLLAGSVVLAALLNEFTRLYPKVRVRVLSGNAREMLRSLRAGDVDFVIGLLRNPASEDLINQPLVLTPLAVVARKGHPLASKPHVTFDDLSQYEWIIGTPGSSRRKHFEGMFEGRKRPSARLEMSSLPIIRLLLSQNDYLTLLTSYELLHDGTDLISVPIAATGESPSIGLTTRENWLPTDLQAKFIELVQERLVGS